MFDINEQKAKELISKFQVPAKPEILTQIQQEQSKDDPSPTAFAEVISKDVALSAAVLKAVNSPVFGLKRSVKDIKQSVILLGCQNVTNLVSFFQLKNSFNKKSSISHEKYWDTALETANMATILLELLNLKSAIPIEDAYSFGLFRDCGIPLMAMKYEDYREVLMKANNNPQVLFTDIEEQHYQTNHSIVGFFVANSWNLPKDLCELILRHHETNFLKASDTTPEQKDIYALVKLASNVLSHYHLMKDDCEWYLAREAVLSHFRLSDIDYEDLEADAKESFKLKYADL